MKKNNKVNPLTHFNNIKADSYRRAHNQMSNFKNSVKRYALGGGPGDPPKEETDGTSTAASSGGKSQLSAEEIERRRQEQRTKELGSMTGKQYRQEKKGIKRAQKLDRIASGKQAERVDNIIKSVGSGIEAAGNFADVVKSGREAFGPKQQRKGGSVKKMSKGGSLKPVPAGKVGLSKLPTPVRNKMGYQKKGGSIKRK
jgi:hypothetical protein